MNFETVAREVLELKKLRAKNTQLAAGMQINRLIRNFGWLELSKITEKLWVRYILREKRRRRSFFDDRKYMRMILLYAHRHGHLTTIIRLEIPTDLSPEVGREISRKEVRLLLASANPQLAFQIEIAYRMGLRLREMLHLRWDRFDWKQGAILLRKEDTKPRRARRVPIPPHLFPKFQAARVLSNSPYVFPHRSDSARAQHDNKSAWRKVKKKVGIECRWHDLRHSCATVMLRKGVPDHIIRKYLGMSSWVLHRIYAHLSSDDLAIAARAMNDRI